MNRVWKVSIAFSVIFTAASAALVLRVVDRVGTTRNGAILVNTGEWVKPSGVTVTLSQAVLDGLVLAGGSTALVKTSSGLALIDIKNGRTIQQLSMPGGSSMTGLCVSPTDGTIAASGATSSVFLYKLDGSKLTLLRRLTLPAASVGGAAYPCGTAFWKPDSLAIAASRDNSVTVISPADGKVIRRIACDPDPYSLCLVGPHKAVVACWGRPPKSGGASATSSGTSVEVDQRGITPGGSLDLVDLQSGTVERRIDCLGQPTEMCLSSGTLYIAFANGDRIGAFDAGSLEPHGTFVPTERTASAPNSIAIDESRSKLYVAYGGLNRLAAYDLRTRKLLGVERTAWYPSLVRVVPGGGLVVGTAKGFGSRARKTSKHSDYDFTSTVSYLAHPSFAGNLGQGVHEVTTTHPGAPTPVPARLGDPSVFKHVVYVIKENRTYDQVLGDLGEGDGDPAYTMYGKDITPNHHALASEFVDLDNYYCNGILSADGHAWATESNATSFYEHSQGGWTRSYPFGDDPLATTYTGYIWDDALSHHVSVRNFGEFDYASADPDMSWSEVYKRFLAGQPLQFKQNIGVARLRNVSIREFPGWDLGIPDVLRADRFIKELHAEEQNGSMAALTILYLPDDHTSGGSPGFPSPRAQLADNDLALGRCVEALSRSKFWPSTVVFVNEDDPQDGYDHVDGYRSLCLVASPYAKRHEVVSDFYNQASVLHTIERILGLPPMNHNDAEASLMTDCFRSSPDLTPYQARPNNIPLDEKLHTKETVRFPLGEPDDADPAAFSRRLWQIAKGTDAKP